MTIERWTRIVGILLAAILMLLPCAAVAAAATPDVMNASMRGGEEVPGKDTGTRENILPVVGAPALVTPSILEDPAQEGAFRGATQTVSDWNALEAWLEQNSDTGGSVALRGDIALTAREESYLLWANAPIEIDAGSYGFIIQAGATLGIQNNVCITGEGTARPIIDVQDAGCLYEVTDSDSPFELTVLGEGGIGIRLRGGASYTRGNFSSTTIRVQGANACAIESDIELSLQKYTIDATGTAARGISATQPVAMYLCAISARGKAIDAPQVTLDTCSVSPDVGNARIIRRRVTQVLPFFGTFRYRIGEPVEISGQTLHGKITLTSQEDPGNAVQESADVRIGGNVDVHDAPGIYSYPVTLLSPYDKFDILPMGKPLMMDIIVYDARLPFFNDVLVNMDEAGNDEYVLSYLYEGDRVAPIKLWRSDDGGINWYVSWAEGYEANQPRDVVSDRGSIDIFFRSEDLRGTVLFAFEVEGRGGSHVVELDMAVIDEQGHSGGDRDGGDRLLPWTVFANRTPDEGSGAEGKGGGPDGTGGDDSSGDGKWSGDEAEHADMDEVDGGGKGGSAFHAHAFVYPDINGIDHAELKSQGAVGQVSVGTIAGDVDHGSTSGNAPGERNDGEAAQNGLLDAAAKETAGAGITNPEPTAREGGAKSRIVEGEKKGSGGASSAAGGIEGAIGNPRNVGGGPPSTVLGNERASKGSGPSGLFPSGGSGASGTVAVPAAEAIVHPAMAATKPEKTRSLILVCVLALCGAACMAVTFCARRVPHG